MKAESGGQRHRSARPQAGILVWELLSCPVAGGGRAPAVSGMQAWRHASCLDLLPAFPEGETELRSAFQIQWRCTKHGRPQGSRQVGWAEGTVTLIHAGCLHLLLSFWSVDSLCVMPHRGHSPKVRPLPKPSWRFSDQRWEWGAEGASLCPGPPRGHTMGPCGFALAAVSAGEQLQCGLPCCTDKNGPQSTSSLPLYV